MAAYDVLCVGSATVDHFHTITQSFSSVKAGDKILVHSIENHSGGAATNTAAALSRLGLKVKMLTKVGKDHDGDFILNEMKRYGVTNICSNRSEKPTNSSVIVTSRKDKDRIIFAYKGASSDLALRDFSLHHCNARWVYLGTLMDKSFVTAVKIAHHASQNQIPLLFNPSLYLAEKGPRYLSSILSRSTMVVLNLEEAKAITGFSTATPSILLQKIANTGPVTIIITNGAKTVHALHKKMEYQFTPPNVRVTQTAGAGDAFTSGVLAGLIKNYLFTDALRLGQANALSIVQHIGTKNKLLTEREAKMIIKKYPFTIRQKRVK